MCKKTSLDRKLSSSPENPFFKAVGSSKPSNVKGIFECHFKLLQ